MKITIDQIKSLIKEELNKVLYEVTVEDFEKAEEQLEEGMAMLLGLKALLGLGAPIEYGDMQITEKDAMMISKVMQDQGIDSEANSNLANAAKQLKIYKTDKDGDGKYEIDGFARGDVKVVLDTWKDYKTNKQSSQQQDRQIDIDGELDQNLSGTTISDKQIKMMKMPQYSAKMVKQLMDKVGKDHPRYQDLLQIYNSK